MRGSTFKRNKTWVATLDLGDQPAQRCDACGRHGLFWIGKAKLEACPRCGGELRDVEERRREWHGRFKLKKDAEDWLDDKVGEKKGGTYARPSKQTVGEYLTGWIGGIRPHVRPSTWASYSLNVEHHLKPALGQIGLKQLSAARLNAFYAELLTEGLSPRTVRYVHTIIRKAIGDGVDAGELSINVAARAKPPRAQQSSKATEEPWSEQELRAFLAHVKDDRLYAAWTLAATTGMRRGEVLGLRWNDVDLDRAALSVRQTLVNVNYEMQFSTPKTDQGRREIALDPGTVAVLKEHRRRQLEERLAWGEVWTANQEVLESHGGLVFTREDGRPVHPDRFRSTFDRLVRDAGLRRIRFHGLRHTWATLALRRGIHPKVVQERLGHRSIGITLDTYSHAIPAMDAEAAVTVAAGLFES